MSETRLDSAPVLFASVTPERPQGGLRVSMAVAVILALLMRRARASFGNPLGLLIWLLGTVIGLVTLWLLLGHAPELRGQRIGYLLPGILGLITLAGFSAAPGTLSSDASNGVIAMLLLSPAPSWTYVAALLGGHTLSMAAKGLTLILVGVWLLEGQLSLEPFAVASALAIMMLAALLFASAGLLMMFLVPVEIVNRITVLLISAFAGLASTAYLPLERLPAAFGVIAPWNPISWASNAMRRLFFPAPGGSWLTLEIGWLGLASLAMTGLAVLAAPRLEGVAAK